MSQLPTSPANQEAAHPARVLDHDRAETWRVRIVTPADFRAMGSDPIVFAMANPVPEIQTEALVGIAGVVATGRSDYANQINNSLAFPGVFRGALDARARDISQAMKMAAVEAIAGLVAEDELHEDYILPSMFDRRVAEAVAAAVAPRPQHQARKFHRESPRQRAVRRIALTARPRQHQRRCDR
jgi:malic enzyme